MSAFDDAKQLLEWAEADINRLQKLCSALIDDVKTERVVDTEPETGNKIFKIILDKKLPPDATRLSTQAILHLRHALDQAACAAWRCSDLGEIPNRLYYPVRTTPNDFEGTMKTEPYARLNEAVIDGFRQMQPYPARKGEWDGNPHIVALSDAASRKHSMVCKVLGQVGSISISNGLIIGPITDIFDIRWDIENGEMILGKTIPNGQLNYNLSIGLGVTLSGAGKLDGKPLIQNLFAILENCKKAVARLELACGV